MITRAAVLGLLSLSVFRPAAFGQTPVCNDAAIMSLKGKWINESVSRPPPRELTNEQALQIAKRADAVHPLLLEAYPELVGMQVGRQWHVYGGSPITGLLAYSYRGGLSEYFCAPKASPGSILGKLGAPSKPVYDSESELTNLQVHFNNIGSVVEELPGMTVGGRQVLHRPRPTGTWKGYDRYVRESGQLVSHVLLTRKGTALFRPVTRKQYLDYMIATFGSRYDETIAGANEILRNPDASRVPEFVEGARRSIADAARVRDEMSAPFQEALKKHAADGTLGSPAIVAGMTPLSEEIFTTEEEGGQALVTVNPEYFRRDLPPYVPQVVVVSWMSKPGVASENFRKLVEANFPIEKLKAMVDK